MLREEEKLIRERKFKDEHHERRYSEYIKENAIDLESQAIPKGVKASLFFLYAPVSIMVGSLALIQFTSPITFAYTARTWLRLLSLNIAFGGAIHYGIGGVLYEISTLDYLKRIHARQVIYSIIPGIWAFGISEYLLLSSEITTEMLLVSFGGMSILQISAFLMDKMYVSKEQLPQWYLKMKIPVFVYTFILSVLIFGVMLSKIDFIQKKNDNTRIEIMKKLMDLDDVQFLRKVNELNIQYDEEDLNLLRKKYGV